MAERWRIELFGGLRVRNGDRVIASFRSQKAASLLAYLAYHSFSTHLREVVVEALWPGSDIQIGRNNLRSVIHLLREELEPGIAAVDGLLEGDRGTVRLRPGSFTTDVAEWDAALADAARASGPPDRIVHLERAIELYRGELLPGSHEDWILTERARRSEQYLQALGELATALEQAGDLERAIEVAQRAIGVDPLREESYCALMRLYAAAGQPSATWRQYEELERVLNEELGETPAVATRALATALSEQARAIAIAREAPSARSGLAARGSELGRERPPSPVPTPSAEPRAPSAPKALPAISLPFAVGLPSQFTRFFGREEEMIRVMEALCLPETRLLTLTGPGGSGKTRLAVTVAERFSGVGPSLCPFEAIAFVPLADLRDEGRLGDVIADALDGSRNSPKEPLDRAVEALQGRTWLLILDNFEQLAEEGGLLVRRLLERLPTLTCLVTSRQRLNLGVEREFPVPPLPSSASLSLFVDRALAVRPEFRLTETNRPAVAELCERLDGLPLALELAAARATVLTPAQMLARLERRFELLVTRQRDVPARHRTLVAAISGSYELLSPELQRFFARLSVFRGGWTLEAAEAVCGFAAAPSSKLQAPSEEPSQRGAWSLEPGAWS